MSLDRSRRRFVKTSTRGLALLGLAGCAGVPVLTTRVSAGKVEIDRLAYADLAIPGRGLVVRAEGAIEPIMLVAQSDGGVRALSGVCTHLACSIRLTGGGLACPCHGSTFALDGRVTRGPAPEDLHEYPTIVTDTTVVITLD